jgi:tetratricopeptide (TPR) repeat protein
MGLAKHAEGEGRGGDALALYQAASKSHPFARTKGASPLLDVARLLEGEGRSAESVAALEAFTAMSDKALGVRKRLLSYYRGKKNARKVGEILSQIVWITPFDVDVRGQRAQSMVDSGLTTEAVAEFEVALSLSDEKTEGNLRKELGRLLSTLDRFDDAVYHLERAVTLDGEDIEAQELLRQAEEKLKLPLRS